MDTENCRRHHLHLAVDDQPQRCSLIPAAQPCDNCLRQSRAVSQQPPSPLPVLSVRGTALTSFVNKYHAALTNFR
jgi:hypothetical protein